MATVVNPAVASSGASKYIISTYYSKVFIDRLTPEVRWYQAAEKRPLPPGEGKVIKFSGFKSIAVAGRLTEGTNPTPAYLSAYNVTATLGQWGAYVGITDLMETVGISSVIENATNILGECAANTIDQVMRNAAWGGGLPSATSNLSASLRMRHTGSVSTFSAFNGKVGGFTIRLTRQCSALLAATGRMSGAAHAASAYNAATKFTLRDVREAVGVLRGRNVKPKSDGYYFAIAHPNALQDLMSDTSTGGWIDWQKYTTAEPMYKGEVGRAEGCKFVASTNAIDRPIQYGKVVSATAITIMGQQALAAVDFQNTYDGKGQNYIIVKKTGNEDIGNPLNLVAGTVGFKATFAAVILNTSCGIHLLGLRN